jgi:ribosomal protein L32
LTAIKANPELEEYFITRYRLEYTDEQTDDYGSFIPASSIAADDGLNLCDFQCETFILKKAGMEASEDELAGESKTNYWLRDQGTPLYNIGKLLESKGFLVNREYNASLDAVMDGLQDGHDIIVVVNGDILAQKEQDILSEGFSLDSHPNHAVIVLGIDKDAGTVSLYNPADEECVAEYDLNLFLSAWEESKRYTVTVRKKNYPEEYNPQPIDVDDVHLNAELLELIEMIAENAHDIWGKLKKEQFEVKLKANPDYRIYAPMVDGDEQEGHNHFYVPYAMLSEKDKDVDRISVSGTIKLLKRLGYRLVNINGMYRCPDCGEVIEPSHNFCPNCGRQLTWEDFK